MTKLCECGLPLEHRVKLCKCGCGEPAPISKQTQRFKGHVKGQPIGYINGHNARGKGNGTFKHGMSRTPEYTAWDNARNRCSTNPKVRYWKDYGGRGIKFLFTNFEQFFKELGPRPSPEHSVDRIENDGHYEPGNVRWATPKEQRA